MKFYLLHNPARQRGSILIFTVVVTAVIGITLASYLTLVQSQNTANHRSQAWNATMPVIESGIEDALTHLNANSETTLLKDGWNKAGDYYWTKRHLSPECFYLVTISNFFGPGSRNPVVRSIGFVHLPISVASSTSQLFADARNNLVFGGFIHRGVNIKAGRDAYTGKAMVAKGKIDFNGNNFGTDSFDSLDPNFSSGGLYDASKAKDNGDVATNSGVVNSVNIGNANIKGKISTGPGGSIEIGSNGSVGSSSWVDGGNLGIEPGSSSDDMNVDFPDVTVPFTGGALTPIAGVLGGVPYAYVLDSGNYQLSSLNMIGSSAMVITGDAVLYVPGNVSLAGTASILVAPGASLKIYVGGSTANFGGKGIVNNSGFAKNFIYYGLPGNTSLSMSGNAEFTGVIYAPNADMQLNGGGTGHNDFIGASITKTVTLNGSYNFHYDEDLANSGPIRGYTVRSWDEMTVLEVAALREAILGSTASSDLN